MNKILIFFIATVFTVASFLLVGCSLNDEVISPHHLEVRPVCDVELDYINEGLSGYSFGVIALGFELGHNDFWNGNIELNNPADLLVANLRNISAVDNYFILKIFLNYEEASFQILGEEESKTEFVFFLEGGYQIDIPFVLDINIPEDDYTNKLTAGIFVDPNYHAISGDHHWNIHGSILGKALNYDLSFGLGSDVVLNVPYNKPLARRENVFFAPLQINTQFEDLQTLTYSVPPEDSLQARRGEELELAFFASPFVREYYELESYVILAMLDWQQIEMNGKPYLYIEVEDHEFEQIVEHGVFTIVVPDEVGVYDFVALIIPNPTNPNTFHNFVPLDMSHRFTIEVIE